MCTNTPMPQADPEPHQTKPEGGFLFRKRRSWENAMKKHKKNEQVIVYDRNKRRVQMEAKAAAEDLPVAKKNLPKLGNRVDVFVAGDEESRGNYIATIDLKGLPFPVNLQRHFGGYSKLYIKC